MDAVNKIKRLLTNEYNVVYHQRSSEEQTKMWATVNPEIADKVVGIFQQEIAKARIDEVRFMASMIRQNPGKGYWNSFERNRIATLEAELSQTLKEHKEL